MHLHGWASTTKICGGALESRIKSPVNQGYMLEIITFVFKSWLRASRPTHLGHEVGWGGTSYLVLLGI